MTTLSRRRWLQKSLLASTAIATASSSTFSKSILEEAPTNDLLKLNWNENPYGPSPAVVKAMQNAMSMANRYADAEIKAFKKKVGSKLGVTEEHIYMTAGSTEILNMLGQHIGRQGGKVVAPWPTFTTLLRAAESSGGTVNRIPLDDKDQIQLSKVSDQIDRDTDLVFICNPNNPTGRELDVDDLRDFCRSVPKETLLLVDEAYIEYSTYGTPGSMVSLVNELPNLIIARTFSKVYGLAGMRIGYTVSHPDNIALLRKWHTGAEWSNTMLSMAAADTCLTDDGFVKMCVDKAKEGRKILYDAFDEWGVDYNPSSTNFVYAKSAKFDPDVVTKIREDNVIITKWPGMMKDNIRITVSTPEDMTAFLPRARKYLI